MSEKNKSDFMRLFLRSQSRIFSYIMLLVPNRIDAEDLMQETVSWMWENFDRYQTDISFGAWGVQVAKFKIMNFNRSARNSRVKFNSEVAQLIEGRAADLLEQNDYRADALQKCLAKVPEKDRKLLYLRYEKGLKINKIAEKVERSVHGMYKTMTRIHRNLLQCVSNTIASEVEN